MINLNQKKASSALEFLIVVTILFTFFMIFVDLFLLLRQIYLVQAFNDEAFTRINRENRCSKPADPNFIKDEIIQNIPIRLYFNNASEIQIENNNNLYRYYNDRYAVNIKCKNENSIESSYTESYYNGLFMFKNKIIGSNLSSTISYY